MKHNMQINMKEIRKFSIIIFLVLIVVGLLVLRRKAEAGLILWGVGLATLLCGLTRPKLLIYIYRGWMTLSLILSFLMSHLILSLMFYIIFTPVGLGIRMLGRDILNSKYDKNRKTYWIRKKQGILPKEQYEKMY